MNTNNNLQIAKNEKNDEFYTQIKDIEIEIENYKKHFKNKIVYCNCDDSKSNFFHYFLNRFQSLKLKKLIATCYKNCEIDLFNQNEYQNGIKLEYNNNLPCTENSSLKGNGDFRSKECIEILKQADIVVTNPPFSLFREYITQLIKYDKKFIVIGNLLGMTYKEIFPLLKENKIWLGHSISSGDREFQVPNNHSLNDPTLRIDKEGNKFIKIKGVRWFTNLEHNKKNEKLILTENYKGNEKNYPKYDNYNAINIDRTKDIPKDYKGHMGVPITFIDKYNPNQFEIIKFRKGDDNKDLKVNNKDKFARIIIKRKTRKPNNSLT